MALIDSRGGARRKAPNDTNVLPRPSFTPENDPQTPSPFQADPAPGGMPGTPENPNTGWSGGIENMIRKMAPYNFGSVMGADAGKFNDPNKHDFKYDTLRTLSGFDPRQGFTPDVLAALNRLGYGTFSSSGKDKLSLTGAKNAKDAADFANQDWIYAYDAQNGDTRWNFGGGGAAPQEMPTTPQQQAYGPDPNAQFYAPTLFPSYQPPPQQPQMPAIFSDPNFWQQLVSAMQPQYAPGYSNAPTPSFAGAQYGTSQPPVMQQNPQIMQLLTQLFAGLAGGTNGTSR